MQGVDAPLLRLSYNICRVEIASYGLTRRSDLISLIGFEAIKAKAVFMRIYSYRSNIQLSSSSQYPNSNLTTISYQQPLERRLVSIASHICFLNFRPILDL